MFLNHKTKSEGPSFLLPHYFHKHHIIHKQQHEMNQVLLRKVFNLQSIFPINRSFPFYWLIIIGITCNHKRFSMIMFAAENEGEYRFDDSSKILISGKFCPKTTSISSQTILSRRSFHKAWKVWMKAADPFVCPCFKSNTIVTYGVDMSKVKKKMFPDRPHYFRGVVHLGI